MAHAKLPVPSIVANTSEGLPPVIEILAFDPNVEFPNTDKSPMLLRLKLFALTLALKILSNDPVAPVAPVTPVAPVAPVGPATPVAPVRPVAPSVPATPVAPVAPSMAHPVAPVGPLGP